MSGALMFAVVVLLAVLFALGRKWYESVRADRIRAYMFPKGLFDKHAEKHPSLSVKDRQLVARALRQFFLAHLKSGRKFVSMPSQVVDDLWHEFILYTREYETFCRGAFGKFLHHTPAVVLSKDKQTNTGLRRVWWQCCLEENINPRSPTRLPLLFALDEKLNVAAGFRYAVDCKGVHRAGDETDEKKKSDGGAVYCGGDMSSSDFDGSTDGFGDSDGGDGGDGGGGCGGD